MIQFLLHTLTVLIWILESKVNQPQKREPHNAVQPNSTFLTTSEDLPPLKFLTSPIDYEAHIGTKLDYIFFNSFDMLRTAELALLQNQCELNTPQS